MLITMYSLEYNPVLLVFRNNLQQLLHYANYTYTQNMYV